jgi:hypothetical protein
VFSLSIVLLLLGDALGRDSVGSGSSGKWSAGLRWDMSETVCLGIEMNIYDELLCFVDFLYGSNRPRLHVAQMYSHLPPWLRGGEPVRTLHAVLHQALT